MIYEKQFSAEYDMKSPESGVQKTLIIASTPRSGSHMLGHALHSTGCFGFPLEYIHPINKLTWRKRFGVRTDSEAIQSLFQNRTSPNGVFGIKMHFSHVQAFGGINKVAKVFPNTFFVLLTRRSLVEQAVSFEIGRQSGEWISGQVTSNRSAPTYSYRRVDAALRSIIRENASWEYTIGRLGLNCMRLDFDTARSDIAGAVADIATFIDISVPSEHLPRVHVTVAQTNPIKREWKERFIRDSSCKSTDLFPLEGRGMSYRVLRRVKREAKRIF